VANLGNRRGDESIFVDLCGNSQCCCASDLTAGKPSLLEPLFLISLFRVA
jgi:hypothetical protein